MVEISSSPVMVSGPREFFSLERLFGDFRRRSERWGRLCLQMKELQDCSFSTDQCVVADSTLDQILIVLF